MKTTKIFKNTMFVLLGLVAGIFITGVVSGIRSHVQNDKSEAVKNVLQKNCNCESIEQYIYAKGIQFSKEDGLSTEKAEYELLNCKYDDLYEEVARINQKLIAQVEGYEEIDLLKLEFVGDTKHETITIKNAIIQ